MPGPLTLVVKVKKDFPNHDLLSSNTGFIGFRVPNHSIALDMIKSTRSKMVAAPSANKFMHISPTQESHVREEFKNDKVFILKNFKSLKMSTMEGFESTILKIAPQTIIMCRKGSFFKVNELKNELISRFP